MSERSPDLGGVEESGVYDPTRSADAPHWDVARSDADYFPDLEQPAEADPASPPDDAAPGDNDLEIGEQ